MIHVIVIDLGNVYWKILFFFFWHDFLVYFRKSQMSSTRVHVIKMINSTGKWRNKMIDVKFLLSLD